jgi:beta-glucosidase
VSESALYDIYVPSFRGAVRDANVRTAMSAYHELNGEPLGQSNRYLQRLLRDELDFSGMLVTDFGVINDLVDLHRAAADYSEATWLAINRTSIDMSMTATDPAFYDRLLALVQNGQVSEERIDESVERIIQLKRDLGLFDQPYPPTDVNNTVGSDEDWAGALDAARQSIVLLKNANGVLPLALPSSVEAALPAGAYPEYVQGAGRAVASLALIGPTIDSLAYLSGGWTLHWQGAVSDSEFSRGSSIAAAVKALVGNVIPVSVASGVNVDGSYSDEQFQAALAAADAADAVVLGLGEKNYAEAPGDTPTLLLPWGQVKLALAIRAQNADKPLICVLAQGRPQILGNVTAACDAILNAILPGPTGGSAVSELLFGLISPSARQPFTYPKSIAQIPLVYWHSNSYALTDVDFPFGFGLSYVSFSYTLQLSADTLSIARGDSLGVTVGVCNTHAQRAAATPVLLFVRDDYRSGVAPEVKRLRRFQKVVLQPQECTQLTFTLTQADDLSFHGLDGAGQIVQAGTFTVSVQDLDTTAAFKLVS